jgi:RNA polymerase sigma factor (sigma-70 family)
MFFIAFSYETEFEMIKIGITMVSRTSDSTDVSSIDSISLTSLCAAKPDNSELWTEFLRRFTPKIKIFIRGILRQSTGAGVNFADRGVSFSTSHESDLLQNTIVRLVQNGCAALKRFSGTKESELLAYLAVIARSVVRDFHRHHSAGRRFHWAAQVPSAYGESNEIPAYVRETTVRDSVEREILAHEVEKLSLQIIKNNSDEPDRDKLIFQLFFFDGLSMDQIAACKGVGLSKTGVEKTLNRIKNRVRSAVSVHSVEARS